MNANQLLAKNIRIYRKKAKLTQIKAAEIANLSVTFWNHVENHRSSPSIATLERMCETIGVSISTIFTNNRLKL